MPSAEFIIKSLHSEKYIHPRRVEDWYSYELNLWHGQHSLTHYVFEQVSGEWGYIRQKNSDNVWHPHNGTYALANDTYPKLTLHPDTSERKRWALFAFDMANNHIVHRDGKYVQYSEGKNPYPPNGDRINLCSDVHEGMKWVCVNPKNPKEKVNPYGSPGSPNSAKISGDWQLIYTVENPKAKQVRKMEYTRGKSHTGSISGSVMFGWEVSTTAKAGFGELASVSTTMSASLKMQIDTSSSDTWSEETKKTDEITIEPGKTIAVWQRIFIGEQLGHKAVFQSDHFAHTNDPNVKPED